MTKQERAAVKAKVLAEYRQGYPLKEIAIRYGVPKATVSLWAAQAGIKRRSQGCRNKLRPEERDVQILEAVRAVVNGKPTLEEIGKRFPTRNGPMSRANVSRIYNTWKDWVPTKPFEPGDVVRFRGRDYEVVEPGVFEGKVRDQVTGQEVNIHWKEGDDIAVMIKQASTVTIVTTVEGQFPLNVLPPIVRQMVDEVADVATVPGVLPASQALGIVSAALGAGLAIPSDLDQQTFANLYMVSAAESGSGKSVTFKELMAPVYAYQEELRTRAQERRYGFKAELVRLKVTLKRAESGKEPITDEMLAGLIQRQDLVEAELKRKLKLVCEDVTPQKMQVLLAQNDERIFSASADARQVIQAVLPGNGDNPYLKAWSGDPVDVDRISRDAVPLKAPRMALLWLPQPDLLTEMFTKRVLTVNGFLPRVLPCVVEYAPMMLSNKTRRVAPKTKKNWNDLVRGLFETYHARKDGPLLLRREERVQTLLIDYYNSLVERRKGELADVGQFAARWAEQAWRLVVVLHAATYGRSAHNEVVQARTAEDAISLMGFFSGQQLELLRRTRTQARTEAAEEVFNMLAAKAEITVREVMREHIAENANEARALLEQMVVAGKLVARDHTPERGGHPTRLYRRCDT